MQMKASKLIKTMATAAAIAIVFALALSVGANPVSAAEDGIEPASSESAVDAPAADASAADASAAGFDDDSALAAIQAELGDEVDAEALLADGVILPEDLTASEDGSMLAFGASGGLDAQDLGKKNTYLVLGDSISAGYQPGSDPLTDNAFFGIIAAKRGYALDNHAIVGNTADGIYGQLKGGALDTNIACASLITITIGGNDLMHALYQAAADVYNHYASVPIDASDVTTIMSNPDDPRYFMMELSLLKALDGFSKTQVYSDALAVFRSNLDKVVTYIRAKNPDVTLVVETQYNPYAWIGMPDISTEVDAGAVLLNQAIVDESKDADGNVRYLVANTHAAFAASKENLSCATMNPLSFDFHPNPAGHQVIADTMLSVLLPLMDCTPIPAEGLAFNGTPLKLGEVSVTTPASGDVAKYGFAAGQAATQASGATVKYGFAAGEYDSDVPEKVAVGTYTVYYKAMAEGCEMYAGCFEASIGLGTIEASAKPAEGLVSDGKAHVLGSVAVAAPSSGAVVKYGTAEGVYDLDEPPSQAAAGTYTTYYQVTADSYKTLTGSFKTTIGAAPKDSGSSTGGGDSGNGSSASPSKTVLPGTGDSAPFAAIGILAILGLLCVPAGIRLRRG